jgi:hypothetical protein
MKIKRLNLDNWMTAKRSSINLLGQDPYFEIEPTFCKDGIYKQGKKCWFEVSGKAYIYPVERFVYDFNIIDVNEYDNNAINALTQIVKLGLATKKQTSIVDIHNLHCKKLDKEKLRRYKRFLDFKLKVADKLLGV